MKRRNVLLALAAFALGAVSLTSCGFFAGSGTYSIDEVTTSTTATGDTVVTISYTDTRLPATTFTIPKGETGVGIASATASVDEEKKTVTVTITYTDDREPTVYTYPIVDGNGIESVALTYQEGSTTQVYSFHFVYTNGEISDEIVLPKGNGIASITATANEENGSTDVKITMDDGEEVTFNIPKGEKGDPGEDGFSPEIVGISLGNDGKWYLYVTRADGGTDQKPIEGMPTWIVSQGNPNDNPSYDDYATGYIYVDTLTRTIYYKTADSGWVIWVDLGQKAAYTVTFHAGEGTIPPSELVGFTIGEGNTYSLSVEEGSTIDLPTPTAPSSLAFEGWYTSSDLSDPNVGKMTDLTPVTRSLDLYAIYA